MRILRTVLLFILVVLALTLLVQGWQWLMVHLSQELGISNGASRAYQFWSGFGSDIGEVTVVTAILVGAQHLNCHTQGCWRLTTHRMKDPATSVEYRQCHKHHPLIPTEHAHRRFWQHHFSSEHLELVRSRVVADATTTAPVDTVPVATSITKELSPMSLLSDIEHRFAGTAERVVTDAEKAAKSQIGQSLLDAAKTILPLIPEGREASLVVTKLEEVESWAHRALAAGATAASTAETDTAQAAADAGIGAGTPGAPTA